MNRRAFLKLGAGAAAGVLTGPDGSAQPAKLTGEQIAAQADAAIEEHRKAKGTVIVRDGQGQPVPGVRVTVEQLRHDFLPDPHP
ncbi:MAG TPA: twin-arginine translocation signal domain-containing protein, partial [Dongiaceae bacterium]|nr:twin-arginine translocation signal domain-containing protein [Dongiaceae bacterium]